MDIKAKITELLEKEKHNFGELADYLQMSEEDLSIQLNNKTLELRKLESISKVLRVPLYSFFRGNEMPDLSEKPYYINQLWTGDDNQKSIPRLSREIELLKQIISMKEEQLKKLRS